MNIAIKIEGLDKLRDNLKRYPQISAPIIDKAIKKSIYGIEGEAKPRTPRDTGYLWNSYRTSFGKLRGGIGPTAKYALYQHEGFFKHPRGGERKYLENAVKAKTPEIENNFKQALEEITSKIARI